MPLITKSNGTFLSSKPIVLWIHDPGAIYTHDAVVNPDIFANFRDGQLLKIHCLQQQQQPPPQTQKSKQDQPDSGTLSQSQQTEQTIPASDNVDLKLDHVIVKGHAIDKENLSKQQQLQVSISKDIADRFNLRSRQEVYIELIEPFQVALDHVELAFKEQYLGRSDMWRLQQHLKKTCVYYDKKILYAGSIKATIKRLFANENQVASGYITTSTRMVFRSASAKFFLFIQMSKEMWEFDEDGELYFEKAVSNFLPHLFNRWKEEGANHIVSVVLFTRVYYETKTDDMQASDGRYYKDFYKVVADWETTDDWMAIIATLKKEQLTFQPNVLLKSEDGQTLVQGYISTSAEGNVLEAINLALNPFDKHYIDRDLMRTGLSLILITPGVGKFWVNKKLLRLTNERMTDNGIAMDLVCLSPMPLHITPLMCYMDAPLTEEIMHRSKLGNNSPDTSHVELIDPLYKDSNDAPTQAYYAVPHWLDCSFYHHEKGRFLRQDKFKTRCKMYEIQMMGIMEHDICDNSVPYLQSNLEERTIKPQKSSSSLSDKHSYLTSNSGETYLSTSANYLRRSSMATHMEMTKMNPAHQEKSIDIYKKYDNHVFKTSSEPRFGRRVAPSSNKSGKATRSSFDGIDRPEGNNSSDSLQNARHKSISTWHHTGDQRRATPIRGHFDHALDPFKGSPTNNDYRIIRRGTTHSMEGKHMHRNHDDEFTISSSTIDPVPINTKFRSDRKVLSQSPRQAGSLPSLHNTEVRRSSPSHNYTRINSFKHVLTNPCDPSDNQDLFTSHLRSWKHALPIPKPSEVVHWKSLTTPACLPLTTDYFPSDKELSSLYNHYMYTVSASEDANLYQAGDRNLSERIKTKHLLLEMLSQRLAQGFQIIVDDLHGADSQLVWWLSMGHQVHQLTFDSSGQNVEVRRFVKMTKFDVSKIKYKCVIWPKNMSEYRPKSLAFSYPSLHYQWNYLDHLVAGYQDELTDNLRFWRARFIAIPRTADDEEKRIALFESWIQTIRKAKWITPEEKKNKEGGFADLGIILTTMDPSAYVASDTMKSSFHTPVFDSRLLSMKNLTLDSRTKDIAIAMQGSVKIVDRYWHLQLYLDVFIGSEFVEWLMNQFDEITTREKAVKFGNSLMQRNPPLFHSATKRLGFSDGNYYYSLNEEFVLDKKRLYKLKKNESGTNSTVSTPSKEKDIDTTTTSSLHQIPSTQSYVSFKNINFQMSQSMIIDVDPYKKSDRRETAILHYDTIHNPNNCYHFQLNWLGCTAQLVQELVQNWSRQAERCGLKLVEGSVDQAFEDSENNNPFQCPVPITMAIPPPPIDELVTAFKINIPPHFYEIALVRHFEFILDVEADHHFKTEGVDLEYSYLKEVFKYDQYIHQSGVSFIQIRPEGKGFYWVNNRLYTNHTPALIANRRQPTLWHPDALRKQFQEKCSDSEWLSEFWETTKNRLMGDIRPDSVDAWVFENSEAIIDAEKVLAIPIPETKCNTTSFSLSVNSIIQHIVADSPMVAESINALKK